VFYIHSADELHKNNTMQLHTIHDRSRCNTYNEMIFFKKPAYKFDIN